MDNYEPCLIHIEEGIQRYDKWASENPGMIVADPLQTEISNVTKNDWEVRVRVMVEIMDGLNNPSKLKYAKCDGRYNRYLAVRLFNKLPWNFDQLRRSMRQQIEATFGLDLSGDTAKLEHLMRQAYDCNIDEKIAAQHEAQKHMQQTIKLNKESREKIRNRNHQMFLAAMEMRERVIQGAK